MSDTPRTDAEESRYYGKWAKSDFARQLERELAAALEQRDRLAEALRKAVKWADCASIHMENRHEINWTHLNEAKEALAAVKGGSDE